MHVVQKRVHTQIRVFDTTIELQLQPPISSSTILFSSFFFCFFVSLSGPRSAIKSGPHTQHTQSDLPQQKGSMPLVQKALMQEGQPGHLDASPNKPGFKNKIFHVLGIHPST